MHIFNVAPLPLNMSLVQTLFTFMGHNYSTIFGQNFLTLFVKEKVGQLQAPKYAHFYSHMNY